MAKGGHTWQGGNVWRGACKAGACVAGKMATAVDGTHPTGMFLFDKIFTENCMEMEEIGSPLCDCRSPPPPNYVRQ